MMGNGVFGVSIEMAAGETARALRILGGLVASSSRNRLDFVCLLDLRKCGDSASVGIRAG